MSSTITNYSSLINVDFPTPGVDNDTAGFRQNYSQIQNSFQAAANEISALQVVTDELVAYSTGSFSIITGTNLLVTGTGTFSNLSVTGTVVASFFNGDGSALVNCPIQQGLIAPASSKGQAGDVKGTIYASASYVYICYNTYVNGTNDIWARIATTGATWP
jgi:hypothetical protein